MRRLRRILFAIVSTALTFGVILGLVCFLALGTEAGQTLIRSQTEGLVARLLGPDFTAVLGRQTIDLAEDGSLALGWSNVRLMRKDASLPASAIDSIKVGFALMPLLAGRLEFETIEISGAEIDLTGDRLGALPKAEPSPEDAAEPAPAPAPLPPSLPDRTGAVIAVLERQFKTLARIGIQHVILSNVSITAPVGQGGGPFLARVDQARFSLSDSHALAVSAVLRIDGTPVPLSATASYDAAGGRLTALSVAAGPVDLGRFVPPAPAEDRLDIRPFATDATATLRLALTTRPSDAKRVATVAVDLGPGDVQAGRGHTEIEKAHLGFQYVEGEDAIELKDTALAFDGFTTALDGRAVARYDRPGSGAFNGFDFALQSRDMRSTIGSGGPEPLEASLVVEGRSDTTAHEVRFSKIALATGGGSLGGQAVLRYGAPEAMSTLRLAASDLDAPNIKAFWPFNLAVNTRHWLLGHLRDRGRVAGGLIALDVRHDRIGPAFKPGRSPDPDELDISLAVEGADLGTSGALPDLVGARGTVRTSGGDTFVSIDAAGVDGFDTVSVAPSSIAFLRPPGVVVHEVDGTLALALAGALPQLLDIAARDPVNALRSLDLKPEDTAGKAAVAASLSFTLGDDVPRSRQFGPWSVKLDLDGVDIKVPIQGRRLAALKGPVTIVPGLASGEVTGTVDDLPGTITFTRPFGPRPVGERHIEADLSLGADTVARLAPSLEDIVDGPVTASIVQDGDSVARARVELNDTVLTLPWIGWRKGKGVAAALVFDIVEGESGTTLENLSFKGDGFSAAGEVATDKEGIRSARLGNVALNPGDDVDLTMQRVANGFSLRIDGKRYDARPFLKDLKANLGAKADNPAPRGQRQIDVGIAIDRLTGFGGEELSDFSLNYAGSGGTIAALSVSGRSKGGAFTADMSPRGRDRSIQIRTPDAGSLADFAGLYERMEGGAIALDLIGSADEGYRGTLTAENFTLVDEPRLSSLVGSSPTPNSASLSQALGTELRTERAFFDHASAGIAYGKGGLRVSDGIIRGPVFGSSFSGIVYDARNRIDIVGSFMPAYGVNRIFGAIPVVGQILGNGNEGGLIGITYRLDGAFAAPTLTVNPISVIAPGIFRNIFAYQ